MSKFKYQKVNFYNTVQYFSNRQNFYTTQLFAKQDWNCVCVFFNKNLRKNEAENSWKFKNSKLQSQIYWLLKKMYLTWKCVQIPMFLSCND